MLKRNNDNEENKVTARLPLLTPSGKILQFGPGNMARRFVDLGIVDHLQEEACRERIMLVMSAQRLPAVTAKNSSSYCNHVLYAKEQWADVLEHAADPALEIIILNKRTIREDILRDNIKLAPPFSFPGKLLALLFHRFKHFNGDTQKGISIVSVDDDQKSPEILESIMLEMAHLNGLDPCFLDWIENANRFYRIYL